MAAPSRQAISRIIDRRMKEDLLLRLRRVLCPDQQPLPLLPTYQQEDALRELDDYTETVIEAVTDGDE